MIGTNLGLSLPLLSDNLATIVSKTATALTSIQTSIADKATPAGLNITAALSFGGNWATNVGGVVLAAGNNPTAAGSVYYSSGEFYMVDHTGAVKMTLDGAINVSGFGGIGGDYGGANPALESYDTASSQYRFYINGGSHTWADLHSRALILDNAAGTVKLTADASVVTNKTYPIGNLTATEALVYDDSKIVTGTSVTSDWTCQNLHATDLFHTAAWTYPIPTEPTTTDGGTITTAGAGAVTIGNANVSPGLRGVTASADNAIWVSQIFEARTGDRFVQFNFTHSKVNTTATEIFLCKKVADLSTAPTVADSTTWVTSGVNLQTWNTNVTVNAGERYFLLVLLAKNTDVIGVMRVGYDH